MESHTVADPAGELDHGGPHGGDGHRNPGKPGGSRRELGCHQGEAVMLALVVQFLALFPGLPDGAKRFDVFPQPGDRRAPGHTEATLVMALDLGAQAQDEASAGLLLEIPGGARHYHGTAGKADRDGGGQTDAFGGQGGEAQGHEGVVGDFGGQ